MNKKDLKEIQKRFSSGEYAVSDHAIVEARKDGIEPQTITKLEWVAIHGQVIEGIPWAEEIPPLRRTAGR